MDNQVYNHIYVKHVRVGGCVCVCVGGLSACVCACIHMGFSFLCMCLFMWLYKYAAVVQEYIPHLKFLEWVY